MAYSHDYEVSLSVTLNAHIAPGLSQKPTIGIVAWSTRAYVVVDEWDGTTLKITPLGGAQWSGAPGANTITLAFRMVLNQARWETCVDGVQIGTTPAISPFALSAFYPWVMLFVKPPATPATINLVVAADNGWQSDRAVAFGPLDAWRIEEANPGDIIATLAGADIQDATFTPVGPGAHVYDMIVSPIWALQPPGVVAKAELPDGTQYAGVELAQGYTKEEPTFAQLAMGGFPAASSSWVGIGTNPWTGYTLDRCIYRRTGPGAEWALVYEYDGAWTPAKTARHTITAANGILYSIGPHAVIGDQESRDQGATWANADTNLWDSDYQRASLLASQLLYQHSMAYDAGDDIDSHVAGLFSASPTEINAEVEANVIPSPRAGAGACFPYSYERRDGRLEMGWLHEGFQSIYHSADCGVTWARVRHDALAGGFKLSALDWASGRDGQQCLVAYDENVRKLVRSYRRSGADAWSTFANLAPDSDAPCWPMVHQRRDGVWQIDTFIDGVWDTLTTGDPAGVWV